MRSNEEIWLHTTAARDFWIFVLFFCLLRANRPNERGRTATSCCTYEAMEKDLITDRTTWNIAAVTTSLSWIFSHVLVRQMNGATKCLFHSLFLWNSKFFCQLNSPAFFQRCHSLKNQIKSNVKILKKKLPFIDDWCRRCRVSGLWVWAFKETKLITCANITYRLSHILFF